MEVQTDIAIIGEGLAAYAAAVELKDCGKKITVISKSPGATALNSGAWDLADHPLRRRDDPWDQRLSLKENISEILRLQPFHPYSVFARGPMPGDFAESLGEIVLKAVCELSLPLTGTVLENRPTLTVFGTLKPTAFVQSSMAQADVLQMDRAKVLVAGIRGFPAFSSRFISQSLLEMQEGQSKPYLEFSGSFDVDLPEIPSHSSLNPFELAAYLDREENFVNFGRSLVKYIDGKVYTHLFLPPVLGLKKTAEILDALQKITGLKTAETLSAPESVPGWRLQESIRDYFKAQGIERIEGEAVDFEKDQRRVQSVRVHQEEKLFKVKARTYLLATGKYLGGGMEKGARFRERLFHLPLTSEGKALRQETVLGLSRPRAAESQPFFAVGVAVNPLGQALDEDGQVAYDNLFAAGSVLAGFDPTHDRCAEGVALLSGTLAARHARSLV